MKLSWNEIEQRAIVFSKNWKDAKDEKAQAQLFLNEFFHVFGVDLKRVALFEKKVPMGKKRDGYIDCLWRGTILIEMKSRGKSLNKAYKQAHDYAFNLTDEELPEYIMVCDFENIKLYRLTTDQVWTFKVANLSNHVRKFALLAGYESTVIDKEPEAKVNEEAAKKMAKLHDKLKESGYDGHALEIYLIRLLYCLFAEDSRIFKEGAFTEYIKESKVDGSDLSMRIAELFEILDMNDEKRKKNKLLPEEMKRNFKYINGKLFTEPLPMAYFDSSMREILLDCCKMNWFEISPAIFGAMFQEVTDQKKRRELGAHYTSEENILKVIKPLFLDDLREEFELIKHDKRKLTDFHDKLTRLKFLDPACGCGNFLIVTYEQLRRLEIDVLDMLIDDSDQRAFIQHYCRVNVDQFYGIEVEDFPCQIAHVGMWLVDHQMNERVAEHFGFNYARLPLKASAKIVNENALRIDWNDVVPKEELNYIMGNPPFVGYHLRNHEQQDDMTLVFGKGFKKYGVLDYVAAWYKKACDYMLNTKIESAFVSTNSIAQGEQPAILWQPLMKENNTIINFAHHTFKWGNESKGKQAQVQCVIIGFSDYKNDKEKKIFDSKNNFTLVKKINPYLNDKTAEVITKRQEPICPNIPELEKGCQLFDFNNYIFKNREDYLDFLKCEPLAKDLIKKYHNAKSFLNDIDMWCLYLEDCPPNVLRKLKYVMERVELVRKSRMEHNSSQKESPTRYYVAKLPQKAILAFPIVSSEKRKYIPMAFCEPDCVYTNALGYIEDATLYHFGILTSSVHMAWIRAVAGRLEMRYRYSKDIVYNNFIWPNPTPTQKENIEKAAQAVLDARKLYPDSTLADLYDPNTMPPELTKAHERLDKTVKAAYGNEGFETEEEIVASLMKLYKEAVEKEKNDKRKIS